MVRKIKAFLLKGVPFSGDKVSVEKCKGIIITPVKTNMSREKEPFQKENSLPTIIC